MLKIEASKGGCVSTEVLQLYFSIIFEAPWEGKGKQV